MTHDIACLISAWILRYHEEQDYKENIVIYGIEAILSSMIGVLLLLIISLVFRRALLWLPFMAGFVPLRISGGGYHARTHTRCYALIASTFLVALLCSLYYDIRFVPDIVVTMISCALIFRLAPVAAPNKPLKDDQWLMNRKKACLVCGFKVCTMLFVQILGIKGSYYTIYCFGFFAATLSMVAAKIVDNSGRRGALCS